MKADYRTRAITAREYRRMGETGIIAADERVELLDGELVAMPPNGPDHAFGVRELSAVFHRLYADRAIIDVQSSLALDAYSEPQPDLMLLRRHAHRYRRALPEADDALLVVEVSNSTWRYDRYRKLGAYAQRKIAEVWIVHIAAGCVVRFRNPSEDAYLEERTFVSGSMIAPSAFPDDAIEVAALLA